MTIIYVLYPIRRHGEEIVPFCVTEAPAPAFVFFPLPLFSFSSPPVFYVSMRTLTLIQNTLGLVDVRSNLRILMQACRAHENTTYLFINVINYVLYVFGELLKILSRISGDVAVEFLVTTHFLLQCDLSDVLDRLVRALKKYPEICGYESSSTISMAKIANGPSIIHVGN